MVLVLEKTEIEEETATQRFIRERRELRASLANKVVIPQERTRGLDLDQKQAYKDVVIDAIVSAKMPAKTEKPLETKNDKPGYDPLEARWKSVFKKHKFQNVFPDPRSFINKVREDRDSYLDHEDHG